MDEIEGIVDRESLKAWIFSLPEERRQEVWLTLAHRASARVLPIALSEPHFWSVGPIRSPLPVCMACLFGLELQLGTKVGAIKCAIAETKNMAPFGNGPPALAMMSAHYSASSFFDRSIKRFEDGFRSPLGSVLKGSLLEVTHSLKDIPPVHEEKFSKPLELSGVDAAVSAVVHAVAILNDQSRAQMWREIRCDAASLILDEIFDRFPIWQTGTNPLEADWSNAKSRIPQGPNGHIDKSAWGENLTGDWTFWVDWYEALLKGEQLDATMVAEIAELREEGQDWDYLWTQKPAELNRRVMAIYRRYYPLTTPLSDATVAEFSHDPVEDWMEMVGLPSDVDHIREPDAVQAFLDDCEDLRERLQDFADYSNDLKGPRNFSGVLSTGADKLLGVLAHAENKDHLKARRLVALGGDLFFWSKDENARAELGDGLCRQLDSALGQLKDVCRRHFAPSMAAMQALDGLDVSDHTPEEWAGAIDAALKRLDAADGDALVPLSPSSRAVLEDMLAELRLLAAARAEARTDEWKSETDKRIAHSVGSTTATIGRYIERGSEAAKKTGAGIDETVKWYKRLNSGKEIWEFIKALLETGGPPPT